MRPLDEAGLPAGVANLVLGAGADGGRAAGRRTPRSTWSPSPAASSPAAASWPPPPPTVKKVALELGGKNPNIVFADADRETALDFALTAVFLHSGQVCSAGARLIVEASIHDEFVDELVARAERIRSAGRSTTRPRPGRSSAPATATRSRRTSPPALAEGAELRCGGARPDDAALADGFYYLPTILDRLHRRHERRARRVVRPGADGRDVRRRGRRRAPWPTTASTAWPARCGPRTPARRAGRRRLRMGTVWINDYHPYVPQAEWGGYKQSGIGRELGLDGPRRSTARPSTSGTTSDPAPAALVRRQR